MGVYRRRRPANKQGPEAVRERIAVDCLGLRSTQSSLRFNDLLDERHE